MNTKLFAGGTSLFSVTHGSQTSANDLEKDLEMMLTGLLNGK